MFCLIAAFSGSNTVTVFFGRRFVNLTSDVLRTLGELDISALSL